MKKLCLLVFALLVVLLSATLCYASDEVFESPDIKVIIDGKTGTYTDVPIIVNERTLLPLRAVLVNLGVPNDDKHIIWNDSEKSVTVYKDVYKEKLILTTKIYLKINSQTAYVNDVPLNLDSAPVIYKDKTYIPARFVAQSLGKKVAWDASTRSVLIREESEFNQIKDILQKSDTAMHNISKARLKMDMGMDMVQNEVKVNISAKIAAEINNKDKVMHMLMSMKMLGMDINLDSYYANNISYNKNPLTGKWEKQTLSKTEYDKKFNDDTSILNTNDVLCTGLVMANSSNPNEILLKGNVGIDELVNKANGSANASRIDFNSFYIEIYIDKNTYLLNRISMSAGGTVETNNGAPNMNMKIECVYSDYNGNFEITIPEDVTKNSVEKAVENKFY